ncbi:MAG TPA: hypothetical protein VF804_05285 [Holophagaceae bacterium]
MYVIPVPDSQDLSCACRDWRAHWRRFAPVPHPMVLPSEACSTLGCPGGFSRGVHVRKVGMPSAEDLNLYIIPLCDDCWQASRDHPFRVKATTGFAPADLRTTCRK